MWVPCHSPSSRARNFPQKKRGGRGGEKGGKLFHLKLQLKGRIMKEEKKREEKGRFTAKSRALTSFLNFLTHPRYRKKKKGGRKKRKREEKEGGGGGKERIRATHASWLL